MIFYKLYQIKNLMGQQSLCGQSKQEHYDPLAFKIEKDERENGIIHTQQLQCTNKEVQKILNTYAEKLKEEKTLYKDPNMPSNPIILKSNTNQFNCTYQRPYKFLIGCQRGKSYKLIDSYDSKASLIQVKDQVLQYFGVFLCFLADKPIEIQKIICTTENSYGLHCIEVYQQGKKVKFLIDDYILCRQTNPKLQPMFTQPQKNIYMWPCILEKAWFKIKGNSAKRVQQNTPQQVFETFLPLPIEKILLKQSFNLPVKQVINKIFVNFDTGNTKDKGYICKSKKNPEHNIGLSGGQYFYLLDTFVQEGKRMFYLRNPCGDMGFRGLYNQISPELKDILYKRSFVSNVPGNFLMDEQQFSEQMAQISIVHYVSGSKITTYPFKCQNQQQFFLGFDLKYKGSFNLRLVQINNATKNKTYCPLTYQVIRLSDMKLIGGFENKQGCFGVKNTYLLDRFNEESVSSKYLIRLIKKQYQQIPHLKIYLVGYYKQTIEFQMPIVFQLDEKWKEYLRSEGAKQLAVNANHNLKTPDIGHVICWIGDIAFLYVQKRSKKDQISIQVNFPQLMNLKCISHPEIRRSDEWKTYKFTDKFLIIFEKISLTAQTQVRQYHIEAY